MIFCARATRGRGLPSLNARSGRSIRLHPLKSERANELGGSMYIHRHTLIDSSCKSAVRLRFWEGHGAQ
jgi:hypothetical protein